MIERPDHYLPRFLEAGANSITVHVEPEAKHDVAQTLAAIRAAGCGVGLTLNPATPFEAVAPYLGAIDLLLIMTVHPGFGGQAFRPEMMDKVRRAKQWRDANGGKLHIEVDGGINPETAARLDRERREYSRRRHLDFPRARLRTGDPELRGE